MSAARRKLSPVEELAAIDAEICLRIETVARYAVIRSEVVPRRRQVKILTGLRYRKAKAEADRLTKEAERKERNRTSWTRTLYHIALENEEEMFPNRNPHRRQRALEVELMTEAPVRDRRGRT